MWKKIKAWPLLLPVVALFLVMAVNIFHDLLQGSNPLSFFMITLNQTTSSGTILYGRIIDILNRGSEVAILALGMTLVGSSSAGTDISYKARRIFPVRPFDHNGAFGSDGQRQRPEG